METRQQTTAKSNSPLVPPHASAGPAFLQRKCACGGSSGMSGSCAECEKKKLLGKPLQAKLAISEPGDAYEQEADRVAEHVMRMPEPRRRKDMADSTRTPLVQRRGNGASSGGLSEAPPIVHNVLASPGLPLDGATRAFFEPRFGHNFSDVRIHSNARSAESARSINARAYTLGHDIVFAGKEYAPRTTQGMQLLAHELTHVVQQQHGLDSLPSSLLTSVGSSSPSGEEVDRTTSSTESYATPVTVHERAMSGAQLHRSPDIGESAQRALFQLLGAPENIADYIVAHTDDPLITKLNILRKELKETHQLYLPIEVVAELESVYNSLRAEAPSWAPVPALPFPKTQTLAMGGAALAPPIVFPELIPIIIILIILLYLILKFAPRVYEKSKDGLDRLVDKIRDLAKNPPKTMPLPEIEKKSDEQTKPEPKPGPSPEPVPRPIPPGPNRLRCPFPTGLSKEDPIKMTWFKPRDAGYYPKRLMLRGQVFGRDDPANPRRLPGGEPLGVPEKFWPRKGKLLQLLAIDERKNTGEVQADFREVLAHYGFNWEGFQGDHSKGFDADHVQDLDWGGPDKFQNLWPMDERYNRSAGPTQNRYQRIDYCETQDGPAVQGQTIQKFKKGAKHFGRHFIIAAIEIAPSDKTPPKRKK